MAASIEITFYNSYFGKKVVNSAPNYEAVIPPWTGLTDAAYPDNIPDQTLHESQWYIEEARIKGGFNNTITDLGVNAHAVEEEPNLQRRGNAMIYSGIYNSRTGINQTNVFSVADNITKAVDPAYGSIQKLYAEDTRLLIFQEEKVSNALIDKDAIYTAEGGSLSTLANVVIGTVQPYIGEYGISTNPESFAVFGYRKYYTDRYRNKVLRLSRDGITEISNYGMRDYFRDEFTELSDDYQLITSGPYDLLGFCGVSGIEVDLNGDICNAIAGASIAVIDPSDGFQILQTADPLSSSGGSTQSATQFAINVATPYFVAVTS